MKRIIIFDFDYTLADSSEAPAECIRYAFIKLGLDVPSKERCQRTVGLSLPETFKELSPEGHSEKVESFCKYFLARADEVVVELTPLFDGVIDVLKELLVRGYKLGIASSIVNFKNIFRKKLTLFKFLKIYYLPMTRILTNTKCI